MSTVEWIESGGGPLLLAPRSSLKSWCGIDGSTIVDSQSDYLRACSIATEIGVIPVGSKLALVLGDEPDRTALISAEETGEVLIIRWRWAPSEKELMTGLLSNHASGLLMFSPAGQIPTSAEEYVLFDSAFPGRRLDRSISVSLRAGKYLIETAAYRPDRETFALIHRLKLVG